MNLAPLVFALASATFVMGLLGMRRASRASRARMVVLEQLAANLERMNASLEAQSVASKRLRDATTTELVSVLDGDSDDERFVATGMLAERALSDDDVARLVTLLAHERLAVRTAAARAMAGAGPGAVPHLPALGRVLVEVAKTGDRDAAGILVVLENVADAVEGEVLEIVLRLAGPGSAPELRAAALRVLGAREAPTAAERDVLLAAITHEDVAVRACAASGLGAHVPDAAIRVALTHATEDAELWVRRNAEQALRFGENRDTWREESAEERAEVEGLAAGDLVVLGGSDVMRFEGFGESRSRDGFRVRTLLLAPAAGSASRVVAIAMPLPPGALRRVGA